MENVVIKQLSVDHPDYYQVYNLREEILRKPIGLSLKDEDLTQDRLDILLAAFSNDKVIGCVMLQPTVDEKIVKLRQMAVAEEWQGKGIGKKIVTASEELLKGRGTEKIVLHARSHAEGFYAGMGYHKTGDTFTEVGIPHVKMEKIL